MQEIGALDQWIAGADDSPGACPFAGAGGRGAEAERAGGGSRRLQLRRQLEQARTNLARRPAATSLVLPAQKITVESTIQRKVLALMACRGPGPRLAYRRAGCRGRPDR